MDLLKGKGTISVDINTIIGIGISIVFSTMIIVVRNSSSVVIAIRISFLVVFASLFLLIWNLGFQFIRQKKTREAERREEHASNAMRPLSTGESHCPKLTEG